MQIILLQDVDKLGLRGEVVEVAPGYARNFLLPRRLAERATGAKVRELERRESLRARQEARTVDQAGQIAAVLEATELRFDVKAGPTGALFGSVTPTDIADELWRRAKVRVDRRKIDLPEPLKRIGRYTISIALFEDVTASVRTLVVPEGGELPPEEELPEGPVEEPAAEADGTPSAEAAPADDLDAEDAPAEPVAAEAAAPDPVAGADAPSPGDDQDAAAASLPAAAAAPDDAS
jgi:large subunit ribosomal protein L9